MAVDLDDLRRHAVDRSLFPPTTLPRALRRLGFVQADPIRAPARAQDLTLRHRVRGYRAGDLDRRYAALAVEEDFFVNYGFVTRTVQALMHPRAKVRAWTPARRRDAAALLEFVRARGRVHPREADNHFRRGTVTNYWGGSSNATTHLLDHMHYTGLLRVARRDGGIRIYEAREQTQGVADTLTERDRLDALVDAIVGTYAPVTRAGLSQLVGRLRYGTPQWAGDLKQALARAMSRLGHGRAGGVDWYWPRDERPVRAETTAAVRLLSPFDPVVWDRGRFELLWGWRYRFEAYTPVTKRKLGYYALPLLWRDRVIGWANVSVRHGALAATVGFVKSRPLERAFARELDAELDRMRAFLALPGRTR